MDKTLFDEAAEYVACFLRPDTWENIDPENKEAIFKRAETDVILYANNYSANINTDSKAIKCAIFEQMIHIAETLSRSCNGMTMTAETITGFGSRKFDRPDNNWLSPRAKAYIEIAMQQRHVYIIR